MRPQLWHKYRVRASCDWRPFVALSENGLGIPRLTRQKDVVISLTRILRPLPLALFASLLGVGAVVVAQIEGGDRGVAPIDSSADYEVSGVNVDVAANSADAARFGGWREAQRRGWRMLWQRIHGGPAPALGDSLLDSIVSGIVVENEPFWYPGYDVFPNIP